MQTTIIKPGVWRHCNGNIYTVLGVAAFDGETTEWPDSTSDVFWLEEDPEIGIFLRSYQNRLAYRPMVGTENYGDLVLYFNGAGHWARTVESFFGLKDGQSRFTEV